MHSYKFLLLKSIPLLVCREMLFSKLLYDWDNVAMKINHLIFFFFFFLQALADPIRKADFHYHVILINCMTAV